MENDAIAKTLADYAKVLNSAEAGLISSFYTKDGKFMPEGMKTLSRPGQLKKADSQLAKKQFNIEYLVTDISGDDTYAFVEATAKTSSLDIPTGKIVCKSSRDFFVLKKEETHWKIYRYMFNNVEKKSSAE